jgi:hypothetical protein
MRYAAITYAARHRPRHRNAVSVVTDTNSPPLVETVPLHANSARYTTLQTLFLCDSHQRQHVMHPATGMLLPSALRAFVYGTDVFAVHESMTVRLTVVMVVALVALLAATGRGASLLSRVRRVML